MLQLNLIWDDVSKQRVIAGASEITIVFKAILKHIAFAKI